MFSFASLATIALSLAPVLSRPIPHATAPSTYANGYLEDYATYHERYLAIGCHDKHDTQFFNDCCHPMLAVETLEKNRKPYCQSGAAPAPSTSPSENVEDEQDCEEEEEDQPAPAPSPAPSPAKQEAKEPASTPSSEQKQPSPVIHEEAKPAQTNKPDNDNDNGQAKNDSQGDNKSQDQDNNDNNGGNGGEGSGGSITGGFATFYYQNGIAGACGAVHGDNDMIAAIDIDRYGNTGQRSGLCGKQVRVTNAKNGKSVTVSIEDACPTCNNGNSIDLSKGAFLAIAEESEGIVPISWDFV